SGKVYYSPITNTRDTQLLDLWEAEAGFGPFYLHPIDVVYSEDPVDQQIERAMKRLTGVLPKFGRAVEEALVHVRKNVSPVPKGSYVLVSDDTRVRFLPLGCALVGYGQYSDIEDNLIIDLTVGESVTVTDEAALWVHEAVYKVLRDTKDEPDSYNTRRIVALMFSNRVLIRSELENGFPKK
ncbi:MAG: hypothetical protein V4692_09965, partial [Bdellovibrionota bacterium]